MFNNLYDDIKPKKLVIKIKGNMVFNRLGQFVCSIGCLEHYFSNQLTIEAVKRLEEQFNV